MNITNLASRIDFGQVEMVTDQSKGPLFLTGLTPDEQNSILQKSSNELSLLLSYWCLLATPIIGENTLVAKNSL